METRFGTKSKDYGTVRLTLTDDYMNTIIEDTVHEGNAIIVNNLLIASLYERGMEFCGYAQQQPDKMLPLCADVFKVIVHFFVDGHMQIIQEGRKVLLTYDVIKNYFETTLLTIQLNENMRSSIAFMDKEVATGKVKNPNQRHYISDDNNEEDLEKKKWDKKQKNN